MRDEYTYVDGCLAALQSWDAFVGDRSVVIEVTKVCTDGCFKIFFYLVLVVAGCEYILVHDEASFGEIGSGV